MCCDGNDVDVGGGYMLVQTLKRAIIRENYTSKEEMAEKLSLLYSAGKITDEQYIDLVFLLKGGEE